jgi:general secretion pathway protein A
LLGNLENRRGKMLQILLAGQPELDRKLEAPEFRQLKQRIALRCVLQPFQLEETLEYIQSRLTRAGLKEQTVFPPEILRDIHFRTQGIPRVINAMCDNLLLTAFALEAKVVATAMVEEVAADMRLQRPGQRLFRADGNYAEGPIREQRQYTPGD